MKKNNLIRYSNCWEDTDNLLDTLEPGKDILSICSGGDNTLALLLKNPKKVLAFDTNINQIYLLKLKISAIRKLSYEELLILLGIKKGDSRGLFLKLKDDLDSETFRFFNENKKYFKKGIVNIGKFEGYFQMFRKYICPLFTSRRKLEIFAGMDNLGEQEKYYERVIKNRRLNFLFERFFGFRSMGKYGRDKSFYDYVPEKEKSVFEIRARFENGVKTIVNSSNPYINYILLNKFNEKCLPKYLEPENYKIIKKNLNKIEFLNGSLLEVSGRYDYFNLSDIFEYMSEEDFRENIRKLKNISRAGAKIVYYNMQNKRYLSLPDFKFLEKISKKRLKETKSYFYRDFLVYERQK